MFYTQTGKEIYQWSIAAETRQCSNMDALGSKTLQLVALQNAPGMSNGKVNGKGSIKFRLHLPVADRM